VTRTLHKCLITALALLIWGAAIYVGPAVWRRFYSFGRTRTQIEALSAKFVTVKKDMGYRQVRCVLHNHSFWSHDSDGHLGELTAAAKAVGVEAVFLTDHPKKTKERYPRGIVGTHDGVLFVGGAERRGLLVWGAPAVVDWSLPLDEFIQTLKDSGAVVFYAHSEKPHEWDNANYDGMEIYNIHTDLKDESFLGLLPDAVMSVAKYPQLVYRRIFDRPDSILKRWERLNSKRPAVGIAANDAHRNQGIILTVDSLGTPILKDTGGHGITRFDGALSQTLIDMAFGPTTPGQELFRWEIDRYESSMGFVNTYLLIPKGSPVTEQRLLRALKRGRAFVAFESLAPARGFVFGAMMVDSVLAVMGDSVMWRPGLILRAETPVPAQITIHSSVPSQSFVGEVGRSATISQLATGMYWVEASVSVGGDSIPWIISNPIYVYSESPN